MSFEAFLRAIKASDPVSAGSVNRPMRTLDQNVKYIWDVLQAASIGSTVYAHRQTVEADAKVGMAVYLDSTAQSFKRALATAEVNNVTGAVETSPRAQVWGIVATKHSSTLADILLYGIDDIDVSQATLATPEAGLYYLSGSSPGKLTTQKPPVSVAVLRRTADGKVFVMPQFVDFLDRHTHYQFDLVCRPAGDHAPVTDDSLHVITDADSSLPGWLPADDPIFLGKAPPGAVFGYNLSQHPALNNAWPPIPLGNAALEWNKALTTDVGFTGVPLGTGGLAVVDLNGIWWMSNCAGDVPWPRDYDSTASASASYSDSVGAECPRHVEMAMKILFAKVNFATDSSVVLSLRSRDARIKVTCFGDPTKPQSTGHLELSLNLNLTVADDQDGYLALKEFDPDTGKFKRGPIVEGVYTTQTNVNVVGTVNKLHTISGTPRSVHKGLVLITVDPADTKELEVATVRLEGAEEAYYGDPPVMYVEFPEGDETGFRGVIQVPNDLAVPTPVMRLRFLVLGRAAGTLPTLTVTGRILTRPTAGLDTPVALPDDTEEFSIPVTTAAAVGANEYVEATSDPFSIAAGDTVYFYVTRAASDGYGGAVGIIRQTGLVSTGA